MKHRTHRVVVAIGGGSGSGKGHLARQLQQALGRERCVVLEQDWYYADLSAMPITERARRNFDHPSAIDFDLLIRQLTELVQGKTIRRPVYDFTQHTRNSHTVPVPPADIILVEGILVLYDPRLRALCDLRVFVDAPEEVRLQRRLARDTAVRGRTTESVLQQFAETVRAMHQRFVEPSRQHADVVINGASEGGQEVRELVRRIQRELQRKRAIARKE